MTELMQFVFVNMFKAHGLHVLQYKLHTGRIDQHCCRNFRHPGINECMCMSRNINILTSIDFDYHTHKHAHTRAHIHTHTYDCTFTRNNYCTYVHIHSYTHTHTHTHVHNSYLSVSEQYEPCKGSYCSLTDR